jgi:hypothetical protein
MVATFYLQNTIFHFFEPFRPLLTSKFAKNANMIGIFLRKKAIWVQKNAELYADFESVEKVSKKLLRKKVSAKKLLLLLQEKVFGL